VTLASVAHRARELLGGIGLWGVVALSLALAVGSLALGTVIVVRWPADQFKGERPPPFLPSHHPWVRALAHFGKNVGGALLVLAGVIMSLPGVPGQGLLVILIGVSLLDVPGKRRLERRLVARPLIRRTLDHLRARFGRPPLDLDGLHGRNSGPL